MWRCGPRAWCSIAPPTWPRPGPRCGRALERRATGFIGERGMGRNTVTDPYRDNPYIGVCDGVRRFRCQRTGPKQKWRTGAYDPAVVLDVRAWLENHLGPLAGLIIEQAE